VILPPVDPNLDHQTDKLPLHDDTRFAAGKIAVFQYAAVGIFLFLISGFWRLQVQNPGYYDARALANSIKAEPILAPRGRLLDRDGRVIVDNHTSFTLILTRNQLKEEHLPAIAQGLDLDAEDLIERARRMRKRPKFESLVAKEELSQEDLAFVDSHRDFFPEMELIEAERRLYPQNGMMAHVIGYTGEVSEDDLNTADFAHMEPGAVIGKVGIERQYNKTLMGVDGARQVVVDNLGHVRKELSRKPAVAGKDLKLTIDLDLQAVAELAMDAPLEELHVDHKSGAVVALDPRTGEVLAMVSRPTFDTNKFSVHIPTKEWKAITQNPEFPLMNKAIQDQEPPGSTFKPITAIAGLATGAIDPKTTVHCSGGVALYGTYQRCWEPKGHGTVALHQGMVHSCDVYFYTVGARTGIDNLFFYGDMAGYGHKTGIDLPNEVAGLMPSTQWKLRTQRQKWYLGETPSVAIGQGAITATPIQVARGIGGLAMGGVWHRPRLVAEQPDKVIEWKLDAEQVKDIVSGMWGVVNEGGGTGGRARIAGIDVCGKTGTAQLTSEDYAKSKGQKTSAQNAWFVGFAPCYAPEIVVATLFERFPGHGQYAAPVVRDVIKAYFDKKARTAALQQQKDELAARMAAVGNLGLPVGGPGALQGPGGTQGQGAGNSQGPGAGGQGARLVAAEVSRAITSSASTPAKQQQPDGRKQQAPRAPGSEPRPLAPEPRLPERSQSQ
jgi:penicillin-binding protein 2